MKKKVLTMLAVFTVSAGMIAGCSKETQQNAGNNTPSNEAVEEEDAAEENGETENTEEDASEVTGTLDEIKDFMFVVTDDAGTSYAFPFEEKPENLDQLEVGDQVVVKYTGTISEVDPFTGDILSIEKQP